MRQSPRPGRLALRQRVPPAAVGRPTRPALCLRTRRAHPQCAVQRQHPERAMTADPTEAPSAPAAAAPERTPAKELVSAIRWLDQIAGQGDDGYDESDHTLAVQRALEAASTLAARYEELEQTTAELCEDCGWRMRF